MGQKLKTYQIQLTVKGPVFIGDIFDRTGVPQKHEHYKDTRMRVSPHILKCTRYQGKEYMMGQCEIDIS